MTDIPETPQEWVERMLHSSIDADLLASEHLDNTDLREAHIHGAVNGLVAAAAMERLRRVDPEAAADISDQLNQVLTAGDIGGPAYRYGQNIQLPVGDWIASFNERAARRRNRTR